MLQMLIRLLADAGRGIPWVAAFLAVVIAVFTLYVGVALLAVYRASDPAQARVRYRVFRDLLGLFSRRRDQ